MYSYFSFAFLIFRLTFFFFESSAKSVLNSVSSCFRFFATFPVTLRNTFSPSPLTIMTALSFLYREAEFVSFEEINQGS